MDRRDYLLTMSFLSANFAIGAVLGDWMVVKDQIDVVMGTTEAACTLYEAEAFNSFGSICGISIASAEEYVQTIQILLAVAFGFSLVMFFLIVLRRARRGLVKLIAMIVFALELAAVILWQTSSRVDIPDDTFVSYFGVGWVFAVVACITSFATFFL